MIQTDRGDEELQAFHEELDLVLTRHIDLVNDRPELVVADVIHIADVLAGRHNVELDIFEDSSGVWIVDVGGDAGAFLGLDDDPSRVRELEDYDGDVRLLMGRADQ